jgi:hypothetical protein
MSKIIVTLITNLDISESVRTIENKSNEIQLFHTMAYRRIQVYMPPRIATVLCLAATNTFLTVWPVLYEQ